MCERGPGLRACSSEERIVADGDAAQVHARTDGICQTEDARRTECARPKRQRLQLGAARHERVQQRDIGLGRQRDISEGEGAQTRRVG